MDLIKAFTENNETVNVNIQGTHEDPLFQANQIGELLDIKNIRETLKGFDEDEKGVSTTDTLGGTQKTTFLTEVGLYRLLGMSRKPLARPFQKWVAATIKEIRLTGKYDLERSVEEERRKTQQAIKDRQHAQDKVEFERQGRLAAEEKALSLQAKLAGKHIPGQQLYVLQNPADGARKLYKLGRTKDLSKRISNYGTAIPDGATLLHTVACIDSVASEKLAQRALEPYQYNNEWYQCDLAIITQVMEAVVIANDGIVRGVTYLEKYNVVERMRSIFDEIEAGEDLIGNAKRSPPERSPSPVQLVKRRITESVKNWLTRSPEQRSELRISPGAIEGHEENSDASSETDDHSPAPIMRWVERFYKVTGSRKDFVIRESVYKMYKRMWDADEDGDRLPQKAFETELDAVLRTGKRDVCGENILVIYGIVVKRLPVSLIRRENEPFAEWLKVHVVQNEHAAILRSDTWDAYRRSGGAGKQLDLYKALDRHCGGNLRQLAQYERARGYSGWDHAT